MVPTPTRPVLDPARDAAALLRRLGFAVLVIGLPAAALLSRRAVVVAYPVGAMLVVAAAALDAVNPRPRDSLAKLVASPGVLATAFAVAWALVSLAWTPDPRVAAERISGPLVTLALGVGVYGAVPERMRAANLYLVPIGTALAALTAIILSLTSWVGDGDDSGARSLERGLALVVLFLWPSVAWLRSRDRDTGAMALAILAAAAAALAADPAIPVALAVGAVAYVAAFLAPGAGTAAAAAAMAATLVAAPLLPFLLPILRRVVRPTVDWAAGWEAWAAVILREPERLLTGHGLGAFLRARLAGALPARIPDTPLVQIWYDLGMIGALGIAAALALGLAGARRSYGALLPGITGGIATVFSLACLGIGSGQAWWPVALVVVALAFVAAERGQYRTRRPRAEDAGLA